MVSGCVQPPPPFPSRGAGVLEEVPNAEEKNGPKRIGSRENFLLAESPIWLNDVRGGSWGP